METALLDFLNSQIEIGIFFSFFFILLPSPLGNFSQHVFCILILTPPLSPSNTFCIKQFFVCFLVSRPPSGKLTGMVSSESAVGSSHSRRLDLNKRVRLRWQLSFLFVTSVKAKAKIPKGCHETH